MKLVIDIPEKVKNRFTSGVTCVNDMQILAEALIDCKLLPEGHGRLIDADLFAKRLREISVQQKYNKLFSDNILSVNDIFEAVISELTGESLDGYKNAPTVVESDRGVE